MKGRSGRSLKPAIAWAVLALCYAIGLSFYKEAKLDQFGARSLQVLKDRHPSVLNLFQASFYFFYEDQFVPGIKQNLSQAPRLERVQILSSSGNILYDSLNSSATRIPSQEETRPFPHSEIVSKLNSTEPQLFRNGFNVQVLMPSPQYGILYTFNGSNIRNQILVAFAVGLAASALLLWIWLRMELFKGIGQDKLLSRFWGVRVKFLLTIVLINVITGTIVFFTLSTLQMREQTERIEKESMLFAQFSTGKVISDFSNFFYFYYADKFLPGIKTIVATNENLIAIRIVSRRTQTVLFDSEVAATGPVPVPAGDSPKFVIPDDVELELKARDVASRRVERGGESFLSVINTYKNENQETLFLVEYVFSFHSLSRSLAAIRHQILVDLVPALLLGLLIAVVFSQLLISPLRRLVAALHRVSAGDYDVHVDIARSDEIGELIGAFNSMTTELKKKTELRKYLSDSTYRQIMESPDPTDGSKLGGVRVAATVLFTDIRNFVAHCEMLEAEEVTSMLNEYFSEMVEVVYKYGGEVDKFIGDALLAVFYSSTVPEKTLYQEISSDHTPASTALLSIYCALEMRERLAEFNERRRALNKSVIDIGVGITHGEIISGPIGAKDRMDFTVIGDVVNLANRIEKLSKQGKHTKIVFSHHVEAMVRGLLEYEELPFSEIRGKEEAVRVYELVRIRELSQLLENLKSTDADLRRRSVELLGQSRNQQALPGLLAMLSDPEEDVRVQAVTGLIKLAPLNDPVVLDALFSRLAIEKSMKVISTLVSAVGRVCNTSRVLELARFLDSPVERIVANAIEAIGMVRDPKCTDMILSKISSRNNRVKANAAMALFSAGHFEVIGVLKPMLMHSDPLMRSSAAFAIGELTLLARKEHLLDQWKAKSGSIKAFLGELQECVPMLVALLKDNEVIVKRQAVIALGKIKDKSAVLALIDAADAEQDSKEIVREISIALRAIGSHKLVREVISRLH